MTKTLITIQVVDETHKDLLITAGAMLIAYPTVDRPSYILEMRVDAALAQAQLSTLKLIVPSAIYTLTSLEDGNTINKAKSWISENIHVVIGTIVAVGVLGLFLTMGAV